MAVFTYMNNTGVSIPDATEDNPGSPVLQTIEVHGLTGTVTDVAIVISGFSHTSTGDIDMLLVGPNGTSNLAFYSDAGATDAQGIAVIVSDYDLAGALPYDDPLQSGWPYGPADYSEQGQVLETDADFGTATGGINHPGPSGGATFASAFGGLDAIHGQGANRVDRQIGKIVGSRCHAGTFSLGNSQISLPRNIKERAAGVN